MTHVSTVAKLLSTPGPERSVSLKWLLRRPSLIDKTFRKRAKVTSTPDGEFQKVTINGEAYVWPEAAPLQSLLNIISELQNREHPNQYLWGPTRIQRGDIVIDIGACEGSFSARASELGAHVIAVEPSKVMSRVMARLFEIRGLKKAKIVNCLLGAEEGQLHFADNMTNPGASRVLRQPISSSYPLPVITLDALVSSLQLERVDFIKCDAEGADVEILKSGKETLKRFRPKLALSTYHHDKHYVELYEYLSELGYHIKGKGFLYSNGKYRVIMLHAW